MHKILVVDDEKKIVHMISEFMKIYEIQVVPAYSGKEAMEKLDPSIQLIILDINMESLNGIEVCKKIREASNRIPIIFLSSNTAQCDKILGLGVGADDYITKPFDPLELVARVKAHIRRYRDYNPNVKGDENKIIQFDDIVVYRSAHKVTKKGQEVPLSSTEFKLLLYLIDHVHIAMTRKQILQDVWESEHYDENTVTTYVKRLRSKLFDCSRDQKYIQSIRGIGYIFEAEIFERNQ
ncbi:response regulator transcription factor [Thermotalea metallivorans]|uniref:Stage 0 sporulation protein A homolog n=1 Tax=Thermotalea metallivorans TaxID=520762 RepID=A0A140L0X1_9FIRM|nr:response regulator transcription factor [Thermotalea metallivorans]KXG74196.1 Transcriptional regulatory protein WalR [Thermotalea metallivorans]